MDKQTQKTVIIVASSTLIGFLGDVIMYSVAASKGSKFKIHFPKGKDLAQVIIIGFVTGLVVDTVVNAIVDATKSKAQKELEVLAEKEIEKVEKGQIKTSGPEKIVWKPAKA
jgi:hypothetical protein